MIYRHKYKPRHYIPFLTKSKLNLYKNSFLRGIYLIRRRQIKRKGYFKYVIRRANNIKWIINRRKFSPINKSQLTYNNPYPNNIGYGRPTRFKQRYRENFYKKQQFRIFYGKFNEKKLRRLIKNHKITVAAQTSRFFSLIESRLDVIFFRRRLIPTIYSCHQFIHHFGLEVNSKLENCPQTSIDIGDIVTIPSLFWKSIIKFYFARIYWRRWGIFIRGRRLIKKFKKFMLIFQPFNQSIKLLPSFKCDPIIKSLINNSASFKKDFNFYVILLITYKKFNLEYKNKFIQKILRNNKYYKWDKRVDQIKINKLQIYQQLQLTASLRKNLLPRIFRFIKQTSSKGLAQTEQFANRYNLEFQERKIDIIKNDNKKEKKKTAAYEKKQNTFFQYNIRIINRRKIFFRIKTNYSKRIARNKRIIRKKNLHFFIPKYIQRDFRTLSIIKVETQKESIIYYPFRISLNKLYSFYRSKGF